MYTQLASPLDRQDSGYFVIQLMSYVSRDYMLMSHVHHSDAESCPVLTIIFYQSSSTTDPCYPCYIQCVQICTLAIILLQHTIRAISEQTRYWMYDHYRALSHMSI